MQTGRTHFSGAISLETILRQTNQNMFFINIERPNCSLVAETENKVVLRKTIQRQRKLAKREQNRCLSKLEWKSGWLSAYWKKTFYWCNSTENNPELQQTNRNMLFVLYSWIQRVLARKKQKRFFCDIKLKAARFCCQHTEKVFSLLWDSKKGIPKRKTKSLFFCNNMLETSNLIANTPIMLGRAQF